MLREHFWKAAVQIRIVDSTVMIVNEHQSVHNIAIGSWKYFG